MIKEDIGKYFNSKKDFNWLNENFGKYRKAWFQSAFVYITENCQLRCKHCYLGDRLKRGGQMPIQQIIKHLNLWKGLGTNRICLIGGEPTLHPDFKAAVQYANSLKFKEVIMDTNGIPPSLDVLKQLDPKDFSYIQISLDGGSPETHELIRGVGTFNKTLKTIKELCKQGFDVRIISTVNKLNSKDCLKVIKLADSIGVSMVKFHVCSQEGRCKNDSAMIFSPKEWLDFIKIILREGGKFKTKILYQPTYADKVLGKHYLNEGYTGCLSRQLNKVSIFPDNQVYLCSYLFDTNYNFAKVVGGKITINRKLSELSIFIDSAHDKKCKTCHFLKLCQMGCPAEKMTDG